MLEAATSGEISIMVDTERRTNPFPGLRPFESSETHLFFGREGQTDELLRRLRKHRFLAVTGTSGSGKSSLVKAGLLPALYSGAMVQAGANWRIALMRPTNSPIANLAQALNDPKVFGFTGEDARLQTLLTDGVLRRGALGLIEIFRQAQMPPGENLLVVVDQFEELFRFREQQGAVDEATAFVKLLLEATAQNELPIYIALTMRSDFLGECAQFRGLPEALNDGQYLIPRLTRDQLTSAIKGPAAVYGGTITPRLVNRLLNDTDGNLNQLPILQHALSQTWIYWKDNTSGGLPLDIEHYEAIGTTTKALSNHADELFGQLSDESEREIAKLVFQILTVKVDQTRAVRRPVTFKTIDCIIKQVFKKRQLINIYQSKNKKNKKFKNKTFKKISSETISSIIDSFRSEDNAFLIPPASRGISENSIIDISHEVIIYAWERLKENWIEQESENAEEYRWLCRSAEKRIQQGINIENPQEVIKITEWIFESDFCHAWATLYNQKVNKISEFIATNYKIRQGNKGFNDGALVTFFFRHSVSLEKLDTDEYLTKDTFEDKDNTSQEPQNVRNSLQTSTDSDYSNSPHSIEISNSQAQRQKNISTPLSSGPYCLRFAYQCPKVDRLRRIAVVKPRENDIFIDYAPEDGELVRYLDKAIREQGFDPWIDFDDIPDFDRFSTSEFNYNQQIKKGILGADVFILVLSKSTLSYEKNIHRLRLAARLNKLIILLCRDSYPEFNILHNILDDLNYFDLSSPIFSRVFTQAAQNIIHLQTYIRLLARSIEWDKQGRPHQYLITPEDLREIKNQKHWIETHKLGEQFKFTTLQKAFLETVDSVHETSEYFRKSPPDIFISYARSNKDFVEKLNQALKEAHWKVWFDSDRIPVAANWRDEAEEGIRYAHTVLFIVDTDSLLSKNCQWELEQARKYNKRIIPVISHTDYDREIFRAIGLSSVQYVSFARKTQTFGQSLSELLNVLKFNLVDLKIYRQLLVKAFEWSEHERIDRLLMSRHEYKEIASWYKQRQTIQKYDNRESEPLLPRQKEYIQASQRYLSLQRKRQGLYASMIVGIVSGLSSLLLATTFGEIRTSVRLVDNLQELDALMTGLRSGQQLLRNELFIRLLRPTLYSQATTALHQTILNLREINLLTGHDGKVQSITFSPSGQQLISVGQDKSVRFWNLEQFTGQAEYFHSQAIVSVAYSSDGAYIVTGDRQGIINLWTSDGALYKTLSTRHRGAVSQINFSPGGQYLASTGQDGQVFLWTRSDNFSKVLELEYEKNGAATKVIFSPNGKYLASADLQGRVNLWSLNHQSTANSGPRLTLVQTFQYLNSTNSAIYTMDFSVDSSLLAFAGSSGIIQVQNLKEDSVRLLSDHDGAIYQVTFDPYGTTLASASEDYTVKLWNPRNQSGEELIHTLRGSQGPLYRLAFEPRGNTLAAGGADGAIYLWLTDRGTLVETLEGHNDPISSLDFSQKPTMDYRTVLASSSDDGDIRLWNVESSVQTLAHNNAVLDVAFRPDGRVLASGGINTIRIWRKDGTLRSYVNFGQTDNVNTLAYSPDGKILAAGGSRGQLKLWQPDINTRQPTQALDAHPILYSDELEKQGVLDLSFSPDGRWLVSGGADKTLKFWRVDDGQLNRYLSLESPNAITGVAFSRDGSLLATSATAKDKVSNNGITVWEISEASSSGIIKPKMKFQTTQGHEGSVLTVAINPTDSEIIASGGEDGKINLWNASGQLIKTLNENSDAITKLAFSDDGLFLASSSSDGTIKIWTSQGDLISVVKRHERAVSSVEFEPGSNQLLASSSLDNNVLLWKLWDLSEVSLTKNNLKHQILKILLARGCQAGKPFLETSFNSLQDTANITTDEKQALRELEAIHNFCKASWYP